MATSAQSVTGYSVPSNMSNLMQYVSDLQSQNNATSARAAADARSWQERMYNTQMEYNSAEAAKNRDWQAYMSNTSHQREVADLKAAGLNPVLSALGGNGASVTSGATASASLPSTSAAETDKSSTTALVSLLGSWIQSMTSLENARVSAQSNEAIADKYNAMSKYAADLSSETQRYVADLSSYTSMTNAQLSATVSKYVAQLNLAGTKYASDQSAATSKIVASIQSATSKYVADKNYASATDVAKINAAVNKELKQMGIDADFNFAKMFPSSVWQAAGSFSLNASDLLSMAKDYLGDVGSSAKSSLSSLFSDQNAFGTFLRSLLGQYK